MKKWIIGIIVLAVVAAGAYFAFGRNMLGATAQATPIANAAAAPTTAPVKAEGKIVSDAKVVPARYASLSLASGGVVAEVLVQEGAQVEAGQPLVRLSAPRQQAAVAQAEADLQRAQARLSEAKAGPRQQEIATARAAVESAQAQLAKLNQGARAEDIKAAEASLAGAVASMKQVQEGADEPQRIAAGADLANAEAALRQAQSAYDKIKSQPDSGMYPQALQLEQATNAYNAAKARSNDLQKGPRSGTLATAQAQVQQAQAALAAVKAPAREADLAAAQAEIKRAQAQLDLVQAGVRPETVAVSEADVASAQAGLNQAKAALAENELLAPFAGTVAKVDVRAGEQVSPGSPMVRLGDQSTWQIETTDLTELNVVRIREGSQATISFDALPDVRLAGKVVRINSYGENRQGDIVYTVVVQPDKQDDRMRWNMTASVSIEP